MNYPRRKTILCLSRQNSLRHCKRLFDLYSDGLTVDVEDMAPYIKRTKAASGDFIAEIMRKAALFAAADSDPIVVKDEHLDEACMNS